MSFNRFFFRLFTGFGGHQRSPGGLLEARVKRVIDGDTVEVTSFDHAIIVRLSAIDCPEDGQPWGDNATAGLVKLIGGRHVYLETYGVDDYARTLATIYVMEGKELVNVNECMVAKGHAWFMRQYASHLSSNRRHQLDQLEKWARSKNAGLWKTENPIPPWKWRSRNSA